MRAYRHEAMLLVDQTSGPGGSDRPQEIESLISARSTWTGRSLSMKRITILQKEECHPSRLPHFQVNLPAALSGRMAGARGCVLPGQLSIPVVWIG